MPTIQARDKIDTSRLERFLKRFPEEEYLLLACHAAFFVALTPGLLYRLWVNFRLDEKGEPLNIPLDAVANLLNSPLCQPLGHGVYELHESLWAPLRRYLLLHPRFQGMRQYKLAKFLLAYLDYCTDELPSPAFAEAQRWTAEAYLNPKMAAQRLLEAFSDSVDGKVAASAVEVFLNWVSGRAQGREDGAGINPLAAAERLVEGIRDYQKGNRQAAMETLQELSKYIKTGGEKGAYRTKVPEEVLALLRPEPAEAAPHSRGKVYALLVAVGRIASGQAPELAGPANDLKRIQEELQVLLEGRAPEVHILMDHAATKAAVMKHWQNIVGQAGPEDHLLFYFSGHAENKERQYLILYDYEDGGMAKAKSARPARRGVVYEEEFREASASCPGYITLVLDTHAGSEGWLDLENEKNVILSATLPGQMSYEQRFGETSHGLFSKALLEALGAGRSRSNKWVVRKAGEWMKENFSGNQAPIVLGSRAALRRPLLGQGLPERPGADYLLDLLAANGYLPKGANFDLAALIETSWANFAGSFSIEEELDFSREADVEKAIVYLEKAYLFKGQNGLSVAVPGMPDAERELFQLELSLEEALGLPVHINRKKQSDGDPATR